MEKKFIKKIFLTGIHKLQIDCFENKLANDQNTLLGMLLTTYSQQNNNPGNNNRSTAQNYYYSGYNRRFKGIRK